jgi:hypothetical protein
VIEDLLNVLIKFTVPANESGKVSNRSRPAALTDRAKAISQHSKFKGKAAAVDYGHFYRAMLNDGVWSSQRQIAVDLGLSRDMVARRIALAQVPDEVATAFGGAEFLSLRTAKAIASIMAMIGTEQIRANAAKIPFDAKRSVAKALSFLATGVLPRDCQSVVDRLHVIGGGVASAGWAPIPATSVVCCSCAHPNASAISHAETRNCD